MPRREILDRIEKSVAPFRITRGERFRLRDIDPIETRGVGWLAGEPEMLHAKDRWLRAELVAARTALARETS